MTQTKTQAYQLELLGSPIAPHVALHDTPENHEVHLSNRVLAEEPVQVVNPLEMIPGNAAQELEKWNVPRVNRYRVCATFWSFLVMGMNDAAYGALLPYLETFYDLSYIVLSVIFLAPCISTIAAAFLTDPIHVSLGQRGIAGISSCAKLLGYVVICCHPPYPVIIIMFIIVGFGNGLQDGSWNAWIAPMADSNQLLGLLHGFYGVGGIVSPFVATAIITKAKWPWYFFYYFMVGMAFIELIVLFSSFSTCSGAVFCANQSQTRSENARDSSAQSTSRSRLREILFRAPSARVTWLSALFLFGYVGAEVATGGWVVSFMLKVRHGGQFASGLTATGFWLGITMGRVILGFVTPKIGERLAITIYIPTTIALTLLFWLIPSFLSSAIFIAFQGFFLGPLFPSTIIVATRLLPKHLHVSAISFAAAVGGSGGAVFPFAIGAIAQRVGVQALQPVILGILVVMLGLWLALPRVGMKIE